MTAQPEVSMHDATPPYVAANDATLAPDIDTAKSVEFIQTAFSPTTDKPVWIQSLGNPGEDEAPKHVATRDMGQIERFIAKWDRDGRGLYFAVSTIDGASRNKETVAETIGLHADIDFKDTDDTPAEIDRKLAGLRYPPSRVHNSGNGRHGYWLFKEAMSGEQDRLECALKQLADLVAGDMAVTHAAALMRLPGTHNTKHGKNIEVTVLVDSSARYELDDLEEWLSEASPVILRKIRPAQFPESNPFLATANLLSFKPPIDVAKRLGAMSYMAGGDAAIHTTQLSVSASMLKAGHTADDVVKVILVATKAATTGYGENWNWRREEKAIAKMCSDWLKKHPVTPERQAEARAEAAADQIKSRPVEIFWHGTEYNRAARSWLIKELIPETGQGLASGQWGACKTFAMLDLAASVMTGTPFAGREVNRRGGVLFIAAEGANEIPIRLKGVVEQKLKPAALAAGAAGEPMDANLERLPFAWVEECPSLKDAASFEKLASITVTAAEQIKEQFNLPLALIVIDTLSASADFADANDAAEGQRVMNRLNALSRVTGAFVLAVDHFGKAVETGTRGSSAKEASADVVLALLATRDINGTISNTRMAVRKLRGGSTGAETPFDLKVVEIGEDETTCIIDWRPDRPSKTSGTSVKERWTRSLKLFRSAMQTSLIDHGTTMQPFGGDGPRVRAVDSTWVRSEFMAAYVADTADAKRKAYTRAQQLARDRDLICSREILGIDQLWFVEVQDG
jgi:AAA domain-containing protein